MTLQVVGAGLGRTGTHSLKLALERLLGGPCYHMIEVFGHPEHVDVWRRAAMGEPVDWEALFDGYVACVDWPGASFWHELADAFPDAPILLSTRDSAETWWQSASQTIFEVTRPMPEDGGFAAMWDAITSARFTPKFFEHDQAVAAYERHNAGVRTEAPLDRLHQWQPGDGWEPLCRMLGVDVPDEPFPHVNSKEEFRGMLGLT